MSSGKSSTWVVLKAHLRADRRKTGALGVLVLVFVIMMARMYLKPGGAQEAEAQFAPHSAAGSAAVPPDSANAAPGLNESRPDKREAVSMAPANRPERSDPFAVDLDQFPRATTPRDDDETQNVPTDDPDDETRAALAALQLQSTLCGPTPLACINGRVLQPGDRIGGFVLESVAPNRVFLRRDNARVMLRLK